VKSTLKPCDGLRVGLVKHVAGFIRIKTLTLNLRTFNHWLLLLMQFM